MVLDKLGSVLKNVTDKIASAIFVDKKLIDTIIKDLQRALIEADINIQLVKEISDELRTAAKEKIKGVEKKEQIIKLIHDKLLEILGEEKYELKLEKKNRIMLLGLYGAGKTTSIAKLTNYYQKRGKKAAAIGLDVHRPAAAEQLEQLGKQNNFTVYTDKEEKDALKIWKKFGKELEKYDVVLIDTAGRHTLDKELINEIKQLEKEINPTHTILVIPADIGQAAKKQASDFKKACNINGVIITRMDSTAKGGGALTACNETKAHVFFITTGEKINDIEQFNPSAFISRILGMGDLETLIDKVKSVVDEKKQKEIEKKLKEGKFDMLDFYEQLKSMDSMGSLGKLTSLIPGFSKAKIPTKMLGAQEDKLKKWKHVINSMTKEEIEKPELLEKQTSRIKRLSLGAGVPTSDIRALIKQYKIIKDFAKGGISGIENGQVNQKQLMKLAKKFGKKIRI